MKNFLIVLGILFFSYQAVLADEIVPEQDVKNEQAYFTANMQKQPHDGKQKQGISNHFTFFTINVQINGKVKDSDTTEK